MVQLMNTYSYGRHRFPLPVWPQDASAVPDKTGVSFMSCEPWFDVVRTEKSGRDPCILRSCHPSSLRMVRVCFDMIRRNDKFTFAFSSRILIHFKDSSCGHMRDGFVLFPDSGCGSDWFLARVTSLFLLCVCSSAFFS